MAAHLLELRGVTHEYGAGNRRFTAIEGVSLAVDEGEFVALLGPSGSGKSTLLRIITGLIRPTQGQVLYRGAPLAGVNPRATMVFQTFALFPWLTVQQNVETALKARGVPADERAAQAIDLLDMVGLDGFETAFPRELSGGMRQKVGFARALAVEPELLCLDEAFSALDVLSADSLRGELLELWLDGRIPTKAILMVTHNIEEAILMADRVVVMDKQPGRVVADQPVPLERPRVRKSPQFLNMLDQVYAILAGQTQPEHIELGVAPGEVGRTRALPGVSPTELAGFLEFLSEMPNGRVDVYRLEQELNLGTGPVLLLTEAAELLGFATISSGDITLTPLGETFAEASILARKEIFATRIRRMPMFRWLLAMLAAADRGQLDRDVVRLALELEFSPDEASQQVDRAIQWGRYAELLAYDDSTETIYQEAAVPAAG
ncbi:MAG: nitrate/sulfonate/bicarbonate ABC transporter ATP-binding protein [Chloroflexota bacterium]|jgi:NitT/TauT family transport system ATP-binding protein|nr:nitrate/sulfonate/bicarbonate ABC transporter ATP-binding protein [Anaerolineae bacterium]HMM29373.1 nitrate/sulfonate/bicarbonate ABC transporter ATP-binding protein [Aggregatilineaceae bacterium]